ncbi:hypothetical protein MRX96_015911 [Rhipicephalus microplus]
MRCSWVTDPRARRTVSVLPVPDPMPAPPSILSVITRRCAAASPADVATLSSSGGGPVTQGRYRQPQHWLSWWALAFGTRQRCNLILSPSEEQAPAKGICTSDLLDIEDLVGGLELRLVHDAVPAGADLLRDDVVIHLDRASLGCRVYRIHDGVKWYELYLAQSTAAQIVRSRGVQMSAHESWPRAVLSHEGAR